MDDEGVLDRIDELVAEENRLRRSHEGQGLSPDERARLERIGVQLDQCWDLLRQRRAREEFGLDPDDARQRDAKTVEHYQQ